MSSGLECHLEDDLNFRTINIISANLWDHPQKLTDCSHYEKEAFSKFHHSIHTFEKFGRKNDNSQHLITSCLAQLKISSTLLMQSSADGFSQ